MVAVTVVALVTVTVFDLGGDISESPDATVQLETSNNDVQATLLRNENVEYLYLSGDGIGDVTGSLSASDGDTMANAGDTLDTGDSGNDYSSIGSGNSSTVNVIAVMPDGNEEVLTSTDYDF